MKIIKLILKKWCNYLIRFNKILNENNSKSSIQELEYTLSEMRVLDFLNKNKIGSLIDIGASVGDFMALTKTVYPQSIIHAFEPIPHVFKSLTTRFKEYDDIFYYNIVLGNKEGFIDFYQNDYSQSSSVLPIAKSHVTEFPFTQNSHKKKFTIRTLDSIAGEMKLIEPILVKVDVQGYESEVIQGGRDLFLRTDFVIVEVSFCELYEGQLLFDKINTQLSELGLVYSGNLYQIISKATGRVLQADALYLRNT